MRLKPRATFKSTLYGVAFILWVWGVYSRQIRFFYTSSNALLLSEVADKITQYIGSDKNDTFYSFIFGVTKDPLAKNTSDVINIFGRSGKGFSLILRTAGGNTVGIHPNIVIVDDPCSQEDRDSEATREQKKRWFDTLTPLLVPYHVQEHNIEFETILYVGTVWHFQDLTHYIQKMNEKLPPMRKWNIEIESIEDKDGNPSYPEFFPKEKIEEIKSSISEEFWACNPGEAPVLMNDFTIKEIRDIKVGDKVVGFTLADGMKNKSRLVETEVLAVGSRKADIVKITLESGRIIRCTPDHKWYTGVSGKDMSHSPYLEAKVGRNLLRVVDCHYKPTFEELLDWHYIGGFIDGDGGCKYGGLNLYQSIEKNFEVYKKIKEVLGRLGVSYSVYRREDKPGQRQLMLRGGRDIRTKLIRYSGCAKSKQILDGILNTRNRTVYTDKEHLWNKNMDLYIGSHGGRDKVIKIEPDGYETVYSFTTRTGNYVVWGYASKNCQYLNHALPVGLQTFRLEKLHFIRPDQLKEIFKLGRTLCVFDPSLGKTHSDYPAVWWVHYHNNIMTFFDAIDSKVELSLLVHQIAARNKEYGCREIIFEDNNAILVKESLMSAHERIKWSIYIDTVHHSTNKRERIISTQPYCYSGAVRFMSDYEERYPEAMNQIVFYGAYGNDDFPDCMQIAIEYFNMPHFEFIRYEEML